MNGEGLKEKQEATEVGTANKPTDESGGRGEHSEETLELQPSDESYERAE